LSRNFRRRRVGTLAMNKAPIYNFHPVCEFLPLLEGQEYRNLVEDIRKNGLLVPIWHDDGTDFGPAKKLA